MFKKISNCKNETLRSRIHLVRTTTDISRVTRISKWTSNRRKREERNLMSCDHEGIPLLVWKVTSSVTNLKLEQGPLHTASDAQHILRTLRYSISKLSVWRHCRRLDFESGSKESKNLISCISRKKWWMWYHDKPLYTIEGWKSAIFSNETNMNVLPSIKIRDKN
jgi:hypothetical protein